MQCAVRDALIAFMGGHGSSASRSHEGSTAGWHRAPDLYSSARPQGRSTRAAIRRIE